MIIWLASYPKSGNTWVRLFLNSLFKSKDSKVDINNIRIRQFPLRYDFDDLKINVDNIITNCSFENLQQQESKKGFSEASKDQDGKTMKFFYLGPKNNWKEMVNPKMINKIEATFQSEMKTLGYL